MQHIWGKIQIYYFWNRDCYRAVGFGNLIVPGEVLVKLFSNTILFFFQESVTTVTWFPPPSSVTARWEAYSTPNPYYICRCRNLVRRLPFERDTIGNMHIFAFVWSYLFRLVHIFWTTRVYVDGFSLHDLLLSEIEFRHCLPVVLRIHNLLVRTCIRRTAGRCCQNLSRIGVEYGN